MLNTIFFLLANFIILYIFRYYYNYFTRSNPLPGPFPLPLIGNGHQATMNKFNDWLMSLHKKYGDMFEINLTGKRIIYLCRKDLIKNMIIPSEKTKYHHRFQPSEGIIEYGFDGVGVINNVDLESWKYNRQFFTRAMMTPSFNYQAVEWTNELLEEMESYWNNLGENRELDLTKWMHRFTADMIFKISTGIKNNAVASYYNTLLLEDDNDNNSLTEEDKEKVRESERLNNSIDTFIAGMLTFFALNKFIRHYVPFVRGKVNALLKNRDFLFERLYNIIKQRRIEIENTQPEKSLCHDMLTSFITANTPRDINVRKPRGLEKHTDASLLRPMTDKEIRGNLLDVIIAGTDTVSN